MFISLEEVLRNEIFKDVVILAGEKGLKNTVKRVSVFDCPCDREMLKGNILKPGDVFITCLEQFHYESGNIDEFFDTLIDAESAGLLVVTDNMIGVLTEDVLKKCSEKDFPVILIRENIPYATLIDTVNKYIAIDNLNSLNMLKLEKIMYGNVSPAETMEILYSINPNVKKYVRVLCVMGEFTSDIAQMEMHTYYLNSKCDIYVRSKYQMIFVLSGENAKTLRHHSDATSVRFKEFIDKPVVGYSRIYERRNIEKALEEAKKALETAKTMNMTSQTYEPLSVLQLLLSVKDTQEAYDFYYSYVEAVQEKVSADSLREILLTMETFVAYSGNYAETAKALNQHENTIRYRVNKVKSALELEDDNIKFYETIAIAVKLRILINEEL